MRNFLFRHWDPQTSHRALIVALIMGMVILTVLLALLSYRTSLRLDRAAEQASQATELIQSAQQSLRGLENAEAAQRAYLITGRALYRDRYRQFTQEAGTQLESLSDAVQGTEDEERVDELGKLFQERIAQLQEGVVAREQGSITDVQALLQTGEGIQTMDAARSEIDQLTESEQAALERTADRRSTAEATTGWLLTAGTATNLVFLLILLYLIRRDLRTERALRLKEQAFIAMASHELRTPLTAVRGFLNMARADLTNRHKAFDPVEKAEQASRRLGEIVEGLVSVTRVENTPPPALKPIEVVDCIQAAIEKVKPAAEIKEQRLQFHDDLAHEAGKVLADPGELEEILVRLLDNSIKYTPKQGKVTVWLVPGKKHVRIDVEDTGIGIARQNLPRVYEQFFREHNEITAAGGGVGLGLYIVRKLVTRLGGTILITSREKHGTVAQLNLKRA